jgi:transposase InsO family protein
MNQSTPFRSKVCAETFYVKRSAFVAERCVFVQTVSGSLAASLAEYFPDYNEERIHASLDYQTPMAVYLPT